MRIVRIMSDVGAKSSCINLFKNLDLLPVSCQYILLLMMFVVDNQKHCQINLSVHGLEWIPETRISFISPLTIFHVFREVVSTLL